MRTLLGIMLLMLPMTPSATAHAQTESRSAGPAQQLTALLNARGLDAISTRDPDDPNRFIAALYFPGAQLLVVSAKYPAPAVLEQRIEQKQYRDLYMDLQSAAMRNGRMFVQDLQADGLRPTCQSGQPFDSVYENGELKAIFNGDWKGQKLSAVSYNALFASADERYARMLSALVSALQP